jgi:hypothetical protein
MDSPYQYDAFISYRHGGPDEAFAFKLLRDLESAGYAVAIDARDFRANATFLDEMERCIKQSRFTLAVISPRYLGSGNCNEEAVICKVLDMGERQRRLIPLVIEAAESPVWLYDLVGVDFTATNPLVPPLEKLEGTLGNPSTGPSHTASSAASRPAPKPQPGERPGSPASVPGRPEIRRYSVVIGIVLSFLVLFVSRYSGCTRKPSPDPPAPVATQPMTIALIDSDGQVVESEAEGYLTSLFQRPVKVTIFPSLDGVSESKYTRVMLRTRDGDGNVLYSTIAGTRPKPVDVAVITKESGSATKTATGEAGSKVGPVSEVIRVALVAEAKNLPPADLERVAAAIQTQLTRDFGLQWGIKATIRTFKSVADVPDGDWRLFVKEESEMMPGTRAFHSDKDRVPFAIVAGGDDWSHSASRECLQMLADPFGNRFFVVPSPDPEAKGRPVELLAEVCSPLGEASYTIDGVKVSDYCTPAYFEDPKERPGVSYTHAGSAKKPRQLLKGGYFSWRDQATQEWQQQIWFDGERPTIRSLGKLGQ